MSSHQAIGASMSRVRSFPPIVSPHSRLLILGSMPGEASLKAGQYYAHPRNAFWHIMGELFGAGPSLPYQERVAILKSVGVALWDSLQACIRSGTLDASIKEEVANDTPGARFPHFCRTRTADLAYARHWRLRHDDYCKQCCATQHNSTRHSSKGTSMAPLR